MSTLNLHAALSTLAMYIAMYIMSQKEKKKSTLWEKKISLPSNICVLSILFPQHPDLKTLIYIQDTEAC